MRTTTSSTVASISGTRLTVATAPPREKSTIKFPYEDLRAALRVAEVGQSVSGDGPCSAYELAAAKGSSLTSGTFRLKIAAGRLFGVLGGKGTSVTVTALGRRCLEDDADAKVDAFLHVPLYAQLYADFSDGTPLPDCSQLEVLMLRRGVSSKQIHLARRVFIRSAHQAGLIVDGIRLTLPRQHRSGDPHDHGDALPPIVRHPLVRGLLATLPAPGCRFTDEERRAWLNALDANLSLIYSMSTINRER